MRDQEDGVGEGKVGESNERDILTHSLHEKDTHFSKLA